MAMAMVAAALAGLTAVMLLSLGGAVDPVPAAAAAVPIASANDRERARFPICGRGRRVTCVVDGDTIWYRGTKIRIADINTPEVSKLGCAAEARLAAQATRRMQELLNAGAFTLAPNPDGRSTDKYGRSLKVVTRGGQSLGDVLVREGLAEEWRGYRRGWC
jgi:micrococcal nuclease